MSSFTPVVTKPEDIARPEMITMVVFGHMLIGRPKLRHDTGSTTRTGNSCYGEDAHTENTRAGPPCP